MLKGFFQSKEERVREKVNEHIKEGMALLAEKFYNGAMIEFDKAMELNSTEVYPKLVEELSNAASSGELQSALAIGLNLIKENNEDYELANKLGNYARELKDYKQAAGLYKTALKIKRGYENAFYNLAACQAKVDIFDDAIKSAISQFDGVKDYILPEYLGDAKLIKRMTEKVKEEKQIALKDKLQDLTIERDQKIETGNTVEAKGLDHQIKSLKENAGRVDPKDILADFKKQIKDDPEGANDIRFNMGLFAIANKKPSVALEVLSGLSTVEYDKINLLKAIALEQKGKINEATGRLINLLGKNEFNRYYNVNLGLMYRRTKKRFLATKYLIKTAALLDKSNGIYSMKELVKEADDNFEQVKLKKALNYYLIAATEIPDAHIWHKIGTIYVERKKYDDAVDAFREMKKIAPDSTEADDKLLEIHDYFVEKGDSLMNDHKFKPAVDYFHKGLGVLRMPETLKKAANTYKQLNNSEKEKELLDEYYKIANEEKAREQEEQRQMKISKGMQLLKSKNYLKAVEAFESILRMKVDRKIFLQLAALYKGLKKRDELAALETRWEKMVLHEEKMQRFEKDKARKQKGEDV